MCWYCQATGRGEWTVTNRVVSPYEAKTCLHISQFILHLPQRTGCSTQTDIFTVWSHVTPNTLIHCVCRTPSSCVLVKWVVHIVTIVLSQFHEQILCNAKPNPVTVYCPISPTALSVSPTEQYDRFITSSIADAATPFTGTVSALYLTALYVRLLLLHC